MFKENICTVVLRLSELVGPWMCQIIKTHSFINRALLNYSNRMHILANRAVIAIVQIAKSLVNQWLDNQGTNVHVMKLQKYS